MPKLVCPSGHVIDLSVVPTPGERFYVPVSAWDELVAAVADAATAHAGAPEVELREAISDALAAAGRSFYECPECGELVFPDETPPRAYAPVDPGGP